MNNKSFYPFALVFITCLGLFSSHLAHGKNDQQFFKQVGFPGGLAPAPEKKIVVAIVDDGIRISHTDLRDFIWQNPFEIPGNLIDDDGNGFVDDVNGWDVADKNPTVTPPINRLLEYYHGTHLAGIITQIFRDTYGPKAAKALSIMPIKALADESENTAIKHGYQGIDYAIRAGADIILCAWNVAHITEDEEKILRKAEEQGVLIVGSVGNFPEEREMYPAAAPSVLAVASLDKENRLSSKSNYGSFVDLSAPGEEINSSSTRSDDASMTIGGTSTAAAIVAGAAAVMMAHSPSVAKDRIKACLKNSSTLLEPALSEYAAKQGAGLLNIKAALACLDDYPLPAPSPFHPQGYIDLAAANSGSSTWGIEPAGKFKGIWFFRPEVAKGTKQITIDFYSDRTATGKPLASFTLDSMPKKFFVPGTRAAVRVHSKSGVKHKSELLMEYRAEAIDFRSIYCSGTKYLAEEGSITDGSGAKRYSGGSDCKWQITAPQGKVIRFKFTEFDTEPKTDVLYFFNGTGTHEKIMAVFSGPDIPPEIFTWQNKVLVWFVTNGENQGQGWKGEFSFVDRNQAKYPSPSTYKE